MYCRLAIMRGSVYQRYGFHSRWPCTAHANAHTPNAHTPSRHIARPSNAHNVGIDQFTTLSPCSLALSSHASRLLSQVFSELNPKMRHTQYKSEYTVQEGTVIQVAKLNRPVHRDNRTLKGFLMVTHIAVSYVEEFTEILRSWLPVPMSSLPLIGRDEDPEPAMSRTDRWTVWDH
jgi:hypothetical protein